MVSNYQGAKNLSLLGRQVGDARKQVQTQHAPFKT